MVPEPQQHEGFPSCVHLSIGFNEHAVYYQTAAQWVKERSEGECPLQWVSDDERTRAIDTNSIWTCQWYPSTPIGHYELAASSFSVLMQAVNAVSRETHDAAKTPSPYDLSEGRKGLRGGPR